MHLLLGSGRPVLDLHERPALCGRIRYVPGPLSGQALHRVRERLVSQRTGIINQIRAPRYF
jgi:hypothetical protein